MGDKHNSPCTVGADLHAADLTGLRTLEKWMPVPTQHFLSGPTAAIQLSDLVSLTTLGVRLFRLLANNLPSLR